MSTQQATLRQQVEADLGGSIPQDSGVRAAIYRIAEALDGLTRVSVTPSATMTRVPIAEFDDTYANPKKDQGKGP